MKKMLADPKARDGNHTVGIDIDCGKKSQLFFAFNQPDTLIVFVHGFGGKAISTWNSFPSILTTNSNFEKSDVAFYGYKSLESQAGNHAEDFLDFLIKVQAPLKNGLLPTNQKLPERKYKRIILVAHSLGSIVVRLALLAAHQDGKRWVDKSHMVLFAPAHKGAKVQKLIKESLANGWLGVVSFLAFYRYPILDDLEPGSQVLKDLESQTMEALRKKKKFSKARLVVWGKLDKVVNNLRFCEDPKPLQVDGKGHIGVCKPEGGYLTPIEALESIM